MTYAVEISNLDQLQELYARSPDVTARELMRAIVQSTTVLQASAKQRSPIDTGRLRRSILRQNAKRTGGVIQGGVSTGVKYAEWMERGTGIYGPHKQPIRPKTAKALMFDYKGTVYTVREVRGAIGFKYMGKALQENQARIDSFFEAAAERIAKTLAGGAA